MDNPKRSCRTCGELKPLDDFYYHRVRKRHTLDCKACHKNKVAHARASHAAHQYTIRVHLEDGSVVELPFRSLVPVILVTAEPQ